MKRGESRENGQSAAWEALDGLDFVLLGIERLDSRNGEECARRRTADCHTLLVTADGDGEGGPAGLSGPEPSGARSRAQAHTARWHPPATPFAAGDLPGGGPLYLLRFEARRRETGELSPETLLPPCDAPCAARLVALCAAIYAHRGSGSALERFRCRIWLQELLAGLLEQAAEPAGEGSAALAFTKAYMERHYGEPITIAQLARLAGVSPSHYMDLFKAAYGTSAIDYLTEVRIDRAKRLMERPGGQLRDIARQVGFGDEFYFSRRFKQKVGFSPSVYKKNRHRKIASYSYPVTGQLLALHIIPYAAPFDPELTGYYFQAHHADIAVHLKAAHLRGSGPLNSDMLRRARPDCIIGGDWVEDGEKEKLRQIAPTLFIPWMKLDWREQLRLTGEFLGQPGEAERWLQAYERKAAAAREKLRRAVGDETFLVLRIERGFCYAYGTRNTGAVLYGDLGLSPAAGVERIVVNEQIAPARLAEIDADRIVLMVGKDGESLAYWRSLRESPVWRELKAARGRRVHVVDPDPWHEYSAMAHARLLDEAVRLFSEERPK